MDQYRLSEIESIAPSVGKVILFWAYIESQLNALALTVLYSPGTPTPDEGVKVPYSRKVEQIKRGYRTLSQLAQVKDEAYSLLNSLKPIHEQRSILVHGFYQGVDVEDQHTFTAYHVRGHTGTWKWYYFTAAELSQTADNILSANDSLQDLKLRTIDLIT